MKRARWSFAAVLALWLATSALAQPLPNLQIQLDRLATTGSVLMIAAHPDDEHTAVLAYYALGQKFRTAYLSLTRGEGGQNVIGKEQGPLLGVIRTEELLAARRIDGGEQFFTSALDFGYSKSAEETLQKWDRTKILGEMVRVIREFQPQIIILRWSGTPADGHGHHQASAILGREAFVAAADPRQYPDQQLDPWQARQLFVHSNQPKPNATTVPVGEYNPLLGYSYTEIAAISRSQHRSQAMGTAQRVGAQQVHLVLEKGITAEPVTLPDALTGLLRKAAAEFDPKVPQRSIPTLLEARQVLRSLEGALAARKLRELDEAILRCAGMVVEANAQRPHATPGSEIAVEFEIVNRSELEILLDGVDLAGAPGVRPAVLAFNNPVRLRVPWRVQPGAPTAEVRFRIGRETIAVRRPVLYRYVDRVLGERTQPFVATPPVSVGFPNASVLFPNQDVREVAVTVTSYSDAAEGSVALQLPSGWSFEPKSQPFRIERQGLEATVTFRVTPPSQMTTADVRAVATIHGDKVDSNVVQIRYPHIPARTVIEPASARFTRASVRMLARRIGYIEGAGDAVPEAIRQMGGEVRFLSASDLAAANLEEYDAIVTGVRAFNLRDDLRAGTGRLLE